MRILTYNIHGWKGLDGRIDIARLARIVETSQADVVALNEVFHPLAPPGADRPALETLAEALGMTFAFGAALTPSDAFAASGTSYGNALLTRFPLLAYASHHLTPVENHEQRGLLEARVLLGDRRTSLSVYVTHLDHLSEAVRSAQLTALLQWTVRDRARPHLLVGDFNAISPDDLREISDTTVDTAHADAGDVPLRQRLQASDEASLVVARLQRRYRDAAVLTGGAHPTFPADAPSIRIDYLWLSDPLTAALRWCRPWQTVDTAVASDHLPVLAEFDMNKLYVRSTAEPAPDVVS